MRLCMIPWQRQDLIGNYKVLLSAAFEANTNKQFTLKSADRFNTPRIGLLTTRHSHVAALLVERVVLEVHGAGQQQGNSDGVQDTSVGMDPQQHIGHYNRVKMALLFVGEKQVRLPDPVGVC